MDISGIFNQDNEYVNYMAVQYGYHHYDDTPDSFEHALAINEDIALGVCIKPGLSPDQRFTFATRLLSNHSARIDHVSQILAKESQYLKCEGIGQALAEFAIYLTFNKHLYEETSLYIDGICENISSTAWLPEKYQMSILSGLGVMLKNPSFSKQNFDTIFRLTLAQHSNDFMSAISNNSSLLYSKHLPDELFKLALSKAPRIDEDGISVICNPLDFPMTHVMSLVANPKLSGESIAMFYEMLTGKDLDFNKAWLSTIHTNPMLPGALAAKYGENWIEKIKSTHQTWNNQELTYPDLLSVFGKLTSYEDKENLIDYFKRKARSTFNGNDVGTAEYMGVVKSITQQGRLCGWDFYNAFEIRSQDVISLLNPDADLSMEHRDMLAAKLVMSCTEPTFANPYSLNSESFVKLNIENVYRALLNSDIELSTNNHFLKMQGKAQSIESFIDSIVKDEDIEALTAVKLNHKASSLTRTHIQKPRPSL